MAHTGLGSGTVRPAHAEECGSRAGVCVQCRTARCVMRRSSEVHMFSSRSASPERLTLSAPLSAHTCEQIAASSGLSLPDEAAYPLPQYRDHLVQFLPSAAPRFLFCTPFIRPPAVECACSE